MKHQDTSKYYQTTLQSPNFINLYTKPKTLSYIPIQYPKEVQQDFLASQCKLCKEFSSFQNENKPFVVFHPYNTQTFIVHLIQHQ